MPPRRQRSSGVTPSSTVLLENRAAEEPRASGPAAPTNWYRERFSLSRFFLLHINEVMIIKIMNNNLTTCSVSG